MKGLYEYENIKDIVKNIYDSCTVIKDINFDNDIDMDKSGKILRDEKGIKCFGELREFDNLSECIKVYGEYKVENNIISFIGAEKNDADKEQKISRIMLNKTFGEDVFYFSIDRGSIARDGSLLFISLFEEAYYNSLLNVSHDSTLYKNLNLGGVKQCQIIVQEKRISVSLFKGYDRTDLFTFETLQHNVKVLINRKLEQMVIDRYTVEYGSFLSNNPELYILFGYSLNSQRLDWKSPKIKDISFGKSTGYIYCKPIILGKEDLKQKQFKIQAIAKGSPVIEVYNCLRNEWINLKSINKLDESLSLKIRIGMKFSDRLYSLLVYKDNKIE